MEESAKGCEVISQNDRAGAIDHILYDRYDVVNLPSRLRTDVSGLCREAGSRSARTPICLHLLIKLTWLSPFFVQALDTCKA